MPTFIINVETEEPEWVPYTWTQRIEADSEEEALELAEALDGETVAVEKGVSNTDIDSLDRIVYRTRVAREAASGCTCTERESCDACIDQGFLPGFGA